MLPTWAGEGVVPQAVWGPCVPRCEFCSLQVVPVYHAVNRQVFIEPLLHFPHEMGPYRIRGLEEQ